ncbi:MAG: hypothetical protein HRF47_07610 [Chloroflexota bacterium]
MDGTGAAVGMESHQAAVSMFGDGLGVEVESVGTRRLSPPSGGTDASTPTAITKAAAMPIITIH